jgi:hypothetical protein
MRRKVRRETIGEGAGGGEQRLCLGIVAAVDGPDRVGAGSDQLAGVRQRLLAGGVLRLEGGSGPAFDVVENDRLSITDTS